MATVLGSYWKEGKSLQDLYYIHPSEFLIKNDTVEIIALSYRDGGLGRIEVWDVVGFVAGRENIKIGIPY